MKKFKLSIRSVIVASVMIAAFLCSCTDEPSAGRGEAGDGEMVVILSLNVPETATRSLSSNEEKVIKTVEVLVFDNADKYCYTAHASKVSDYEVRVNLTKSQGTTDTYSLVILANSSAIVSSLSPSPGDTKSAVLGGLQMSLGANKWLSSTTTHPGFPMSSDPESSDLINKVINDALTLPTIKIYRMVARVNVILEGDDAKTNFNLESVRVYNRNTDGWLKPSFSTHPPSDDVSSHYVLNAKSSQVVGPLSYSGADEIATETAAGVTKGVTCTNTIYLFEADNTSAGVSFLTRPCLVIGGTYTGDSAPTYYRLDFSTNATTTSTTTYYNILRNHSYNFTISSVTGSGYDTFDEAHKSLPNRMEYKVEVWSDEEIDTSVSSMRKLNVSAVEAVVTTASRARIYFWSDQSSVYVEDEGFSSETSSWSANTKYAVSDVFEGFSSGGNNIHYDAGTGEGYIDISPRIDYAANTGIYYRSIFVSANGLKREIRVTINHVKYPLAYDYVGTFHRKDQTGERVICMPNTGNWEAKVSYPSGGPSGFVLLSASRSLDSTLGTSSPGNAEDYQVTDGTATVSSTGNIYLRVGMASATNENRYAKITITCPGDTKTTKEIYVRQGEDADYLMEPESTTRPLATRFSPFNSTIIQFKTSASIESHRSSNIQSTSVDNFFTNYPSQAGAIFQWNYEMAFNPAYPYINANYWFSNLDKIYLFWNSLASSFEICPYGYHRPKDMLVDDTNGSGDIADSEIRQSLWLNPQGGMGGNTNNSVWGYYADGFFDRRSISTQAAYPSVSSPTNNAVSPNNSYVAYFGRLFYNPTNNSSLFFPSAGFRSNGDDGITLGDLSFVDNGYYWSSSSYGDTNAWCLQLNGTSAGMSYLTKTYGLAIRCVKNSAP